MTGSISLLFLTVILAEIVMSITSLVACGWQGIAKLSRVGVALCGAPGLVLLGLFYSLALHMHQSLGGWPRSIGERGFPPGLLLHASVAVNFFGALILATLFLCPVAFLLCLLVRSRRHWTAYLGVYTLSLMACVGLMLLAPSAFLNWWWD